MSLSLALLLPVLLSLGFWQLDRAAEKRALVEAFLERQGMLAIAPPAAVAEQPYARVRLNGRYDSAAQFLVDNQIRDGRVGYWVVTRFLAEDGRSWLVNRGWVAAAAARESLPDVAITEAPVTVVAVVWPDTGLPPLLAEDDWGESWPKRVQRLNVDRMAAELPGTNPVELRLEAGQPGVLAPAPMLLGLQPEKSTGYAVQWFALAGVLCIGFVIYACRDKADHRANE